MVRETNAWGLRNRDIAMRQLQLGYFACLLAIVVAGCGSQPENSGPTAAVQPTFTPVPTRPDLAVSAAEEPAAPAPEEKVEPKPTPKEEPSRPAPRKVNAAEEAAV